MTTNKTILITGASSGIGKALALLYANTETTLFLTGRNQERLKEIQKKCEEKGAQVQTTIIPVTDPQFGEEILKWDHKNPIDIIIANAGISGSSSKNESHDQNFQKIIDINLTGTFNTVNPLIPRMQARKKGQIILMSSMAGFRGMPNAPAYSVSKVAVRAYGDALRPLLKPDGIIVSTIFPGFVKTPLTDVNQFPMPFLMDVDKAASIIKSGIDQKKASIAFPWPMHFICWMLSILPRFLSDWFFIFAPKKL